MSAPLLALAGTAGAQIPLDEAAIFFEENATDGDLGIHIFWDGEAWKEMTVVGPDRRRVFRARSDGGLKEIGSTEVFTESEEPSFDEIPREELVSLFREGEYRFVGKTTKAGKIVGTAKLSHVMPEAPEILSPEEDEVVDAGELLVIEWNLVPDPPGEGNEISSYQVAVEQEEPLRSFTVDLPPFATSVTVPPEFLAPELESKVEVLGISENGNRAISEVGFEVED